MQNSSHTYTYFIVHFDVTAILVMRDMLNKKHLMNEQSVWKPDIVVLEAIKNKNSTYELLISYWYNNITFYYYCY